MMLCPECHDGPMRREYVTPELRLLMCDRCGLVYRVASDWQSVIETVCNPRQERQRGIQWVERLGV